MQMDEEKINSKSHENVQIKFGLKVQRQLRHLIKTIKTLT
jgi:hypothetical protein